MPAAKTIIALDVGERRIGVATVDTSIRIAIPLTTIEVQGDEVKQIAEIVVTENAELIVVGYPRNQSGEATAQTEYVKTFAAQLTDIAPIVYQDESLTSVMAEEQLKASRQPYTKGDIDARAAAIILQDYMEIHYAS
ncbi:MAG: Holliday junction resolvase RuvX [Chloroflexi bacterium]|nr:MAG: Holliday junction resolvase RuvX [Chloroflexota bacterium]